MSELSTLQADLDGDLVTASAPEYDAARRPALARYHDVRPLAVVRCASDEDVVRTLRFSRDTGTHVVPRGGGHCFAGRSTTDGVVLDLSRLARISVGSDGVATIGAGARLAQVYDALHERGRAIPAGCGPTVGIAGLALGGGLGLLGRAHGLTCDSLLGARVVLADGTVVDCDQHNEPDLFWALRGAGGGQFGVVTSLRFATVPEPHATRFELCWPDTAAVEVAAAWQGWAPDAPDDLTANLAITAEPGTPLRVRVFGAGLRNHDETVELLGQLVDQVGVRPEVRQEVMAWRDVKRSFADLDPDASTTTYGRSEFFSRDIPTSTVTALVDAMADGARELSFTAMGGAYNRVPTADTAFAHRSERFLLHHVAADGDRWVDRSWALAHAHGSGGVYPNFPEPGLDDWATAYHRGNLARLHEVKDTYDPERHFRFRQADSLPQDH